MSTLRLAASDMLANLATSAAVSPSSFRAPASAPACAFAPKPQSHLASVGNAANLPCHRLEKQPISAECRISATTTPDPHLENHPKLFAFRQFSALKMPNSHLEEELRGLVVPPCSSDMERGEASRVPVADLSTAAQKDRDCARVALESRPETSGSGKVRCHRV